jgi:hypothetical protein
VGAEQYRLGLTPAAQPLLGWRWRRPLPSGLLYLAAMPVTAGADPMGGDDRI